MDRDHTPAQKPPSPRIAQSVALSMDDDDHVDITHAVRMDKIPQYNLNPYPSKHYADDIHERLALTQQSSRIASACELTDQLSKRLNFCETTTRSMGDGDRVVITMGPGFHFKKEVRAKYDVLREQMLICALSPLSSPQSQAIDVVAGGGKEKFATYVASVMNDKQRDGTPSDAPGRHIRIHTCGDAYKKALLCILETPCTSLSQTTAHIASIHERFLCMFDSNIEDVASSMSGESMAGSAEDIKLFSQDVYAGALMKQKQHNKDPWRANGELNNAISCVDVLHAYINRGSINDPDDRATHDILAYATAGQSARSSIAMLKAAMTAKPIASLMLKKRPLRRRKHHIDRTNEAVFNGVNAMVNEAMDITTVGKAIKIVGAGVSAFMETMNGKR